MSIRRIDGGARMSQAVVHNGTVYTAGQVAQGAPGGSIAEQTADILGRIDKLLAEAGSDKSKILSATIWLTDMHDFAEMNEVAEGIRTARAAYELAQKHGVDMPITEESYLVLYEGKDPRTAMGDLMHRQLRSETE